MKENQITSSIALIGPPSVGKSLIAKNLSERTGAAVISIDTLRYILTNPVFNVLLTDINDFERFKLEFKKREIIFSDDKNIELLKTEKADKIIAELYDDFVLYKSLLKDFSEFANICGWVYYNDDVPPTANTNYVIAKDVLFNNLTVSEILKRVKTPIIFDMPCYFGWKIPMPKDNDYEKYLSIESVNNKTAELTQKMGTVVLLEPGQDYKSRYFSEKFAPVQMVINNLGLYHDSADIILSTNSEFYEPEKNSDAFENRELFDLKAIEKREQLLNKSEISSLCEQILAMQKELEMSKNS